MRVSSLLPGLAAAVAVALTARFAHGLLPLGLQPVLGEVVLAVLLGLIIANVWTLPETLRPGVKFSFQTLLRVAIVLLGARLSLQQVASIGGKALILIAILMTLALTLAHHVGRAAGIPPRLAALIGVGTAVCGNSAISATAPVIGANDEEVSFAVATNTLFGTLAVFLYPLLGHLLQLSDAAFGTWAGSAVNDTSQVVAAGFAFSDPAGEIATAVKLTRNALMGIVIVLMGFLYGGSDPTGSSDRDDGRASETTRRGKASSFLRRLHQSLPAFVLGFLALAVLNSLGVLNAVSDLAGIDLRTLFTQASKFLILVALAGVGLGTRLAQMRRIGFKPFLLGLAVATVTAVTSLILIQLLGPATLSTAPVPTGGIAP